MEKLNNKINGIYIDNDTNIMNILSKINKGRCEIVSYDEDEYFPINIKEFIVNDLKKDITVKKLEQSLIMTGLTDKQITSDPMKFSDSEKYKLLLSKALINNPNTLILCFPNIYIDDLNMKQMLKLINKMSKEFNKKIFIISNDIDYIYKVCENIIIYKSNNIIFNNNKNKLYENKNILLENNIKLPLILNFIHLVEQSKNIKLRPTDDIKELMKDIYRNV